MKRRILTFIALLIAIVLLLPACAGDGENVETTGSTDTKAETKKPKETEKETEEETEASTETETEAAATAPITTPATTPATPPVTQAPQIQAPTGDGNAVSGGEGGGAIDVNISQSGGTVDSSGQLTTGSSSSNDGTVPAGYIKKKNGDLVIHTISDRAVVAEDNSTSIPYQPLKSSTVATDPNADYNFPKIRIEGMLPGIMNSGVLIGYDGYLFYKDTLNDYVGDGFLAQSVYEKTVKNLKERNDWAESTGRKFYFVIAPNKNSVYYDYMPETYQLASYRRYDQFVELLTEAGITAVDLRGAMRAAIEANPTQNLYYKYDTHWNNHAGYIAYRTTMDLIDDDFPNVVIHDKSEYQINYCETYMKDLAYYLGLYDTLKDYGPVYTLKSGKTARLDWHQPKDSWGQFRFAHTWSDGYSDKLYYYRYVNDYNTGAPNIYIMRDSYSIAMVPFLKDSFYKSTYNWTFAFEKEKIETADADIVMAIVAERNLRNYVNNKPVTD